MSFGSSPQPQAMPKPIPPPYTPSYADPSIVAAGINTAKPPPKAPDLSNAFKSILGSAGGLGRRPELSGRSLITGQ